MKINFFSSGWILLYKQGEIENDLFGWGNSVALNFFSCLSNAYFFVTQFIFSFHEENYYLVFWY